VTQNNSDAVVQRTLHLAGYTAAHYRP